MVKRPRSKRRLQSKRARKRLLRHEQKVRRLGYRAICGVDEAGRGPLAGPVVAAAVVLRSNRFNSRIDDSKKLTAKMREAAFDEILKNARVGLGIVSERLIDRINIARATEIAMAEAIKDMMVRPDYVLVDGNVAVGADCPKENIIKGDAKCFSIAAASIVAKVTRDRIMCELHKKYPEYNFARHKGYATRLHVDAVKRHGYSDVHRKSFKIKERQDAQRY